MRRFTHFAEAVFAVYASNEPRLIGASNRFAHADGVDRVVAYVIGGLVGPPMHAAQGVPLAGLEPNAINAGHLDDIIAVRNPVCAFEIWAPNEDDAEDRLHKLILAFDAAAEASSIRYRDMREDWPASRGDVSTAGGFVVLYATLSLDVLASDKEVNADDTDALPIGSGTPEAIVQTVTVTAFVNDADPLTVEIDEGDS